MPNLKRVLNQANLEEAIEMLRGMKDGNGTIVGFAARSYTLIVSPKLEKTARKVLNNMAGEASAVADVAINNDITMNIFTVE
jgi:phage major head subunit gpT-like protein